MVNPSHLTIIIVFFCLFIACLCNFILKKIKIYQTYNNNQTNNQINNQINNDLPPKYIDNVKINDYIPPPKYIDQFSEHI